MNIRDEVRRLIVRVRDLEDRVRDLESEDDVQYEVGTDQIGFEIDAQDEFDEDASEYSIQPGDAK